MNSPAWCDLHSHSVYSDGLEKPADLVRRAREAGCSALALTDHDSVDGLAEAEGAAEGMDLIPGIELSCRAGSKEVHVLGLLIDPCQPGLVERTKQWKRVREERIKGMVGRLQASGIKIGIEDVEAQRSEKSGALGRPHVARALVAKGVVPSVRDAFSRFLKKGKPGWVEKPMISVAEAIGIIHEAGGKASLAHPGLYGLDGDIGAFREQGLDGLEVLHSDHGPAEVRRYEEACKRYGLLPTGGSDDHGIGAGKGRLGEVRAPLGWLEALRP